MKKPSWKTTVFGAGGLIFVAAQILSAVFDGDPATSVNWSVVVAAATPSLGLLFARDNDVTSEQAGAK